MTDNGEDVLADLRLRYPETTPHPEMDGMVPDNYRAEADRRLRFRIGNSAGHCRDCGLPVWFGGRYGCDEHQLVTRDDSRWCYGPGHTRNAMERWHALVGMAQFVARSRDGQVCHCLDRANPHIHQTLDLT